jgi:hypothetical protein
MNYHRKSLVEYAGLEVQPVQKEELVQICTYLTDLTNAAAEHTHRNQKGKFIPEHTFYQTKKIVSITYDSLANYYPACKGRYPSTKPLFFSNWVSYTYVMGFFFPFTFEVNINKEIPDFMIPAVIAHEQAHLRGFMKEEDAEYAVFLLARYTNEPDMVYSFYFSTLMRAIGVLKRVELESYVALIERFSSLVTSDFQFYQSFWQNFHSPVGAFSRKVNDIYLKTNSQSDGVKSYGRVVDILSADHKQNQNK